MFCVDDAVANQGCIHIVDRNFARFDIGIHNRRNLILQCQIGSFLQICVDTQIQVISGYGIGAADNFGNSSYIINIKFLLSVFPTQIGLVILLQPGFSDGVILGIIFILLCSAVYSDSEIGPVYPMIDEKYSL